MYREHRYILTFLVIKSLLLFGVIAAAFGASISPAFAQIQDRDKLVPAIDSAAQAHAADSTVAGISVAVSRQGEMLLQEGYGKANLEFDVPMPKDAVFEIGSITKQFTAAAILQLAEKDSLNLDDNINEYLPDYNTRGHNVTIRQLLHHTSGIRSYTSMSSVLNLFNQTMARDTVLSLVEREPFRFAPGAAMIYSNTGYFLLGLIIEEASGESYKDYLEKNILEPAGMEASHYCDERAVVERGAQGYSWSEDQGLRRREHIDHTWTYAAGSLCSTAGDLVQWNRALHGGQVLSDRMYVEMTAPGHLSDGTELRYGMGLGIYESEGHPIISHGGGISGFLSVARYYPGEDLTVVALQNTTGPRPPQALADSLARLFLGPGEKPENTSYEGDLSELAGRYAGPSRGGLLTLEVQAKDRSLLVSEEGSEAEPGTLKHSSDLTWLQGSERYTFVRAGDRIVELRFDVIGGYYVLRGIGEL